MRVAEKGLIKIKFHHLSKVRKKGVKQCWPGLMYLTKKQQDIPFAKMIVSHEYPLVVVDHIFFKELSFRDKKFDTYDITCRFSYFLK